MRLRDMWQVLNKNVGAIQVTIHSVGSGKSVIQNFDRLYRAIEEIQGFGFITNEVNTLRNKFRTIFYDRSAEVIASDSEVSQFKDIVAEIRLKVTTVITAINEALPQQDPNAVSIKLPNYTELNKVYRFIKDIDTLFNQTLVKEYQGVIKFQNFDTGSSWIEVVLENKEAIIFLGGLVSAAWSFVQKSYINHLNIIQHTNALNIDDQARQKLLEALEDNIKTQAALNATALMNEFNISEEDQEYHSKLTHSIKTFGELLLQGTEVRTAIEAPKETKDAFPDPTDTQALVGQAAKLLSGGNSSNEDNT